MRKMLLPLILVLAIALSGCGTILGTTQVDELLRAPQPTARLSAVQKALGSYLNESLQLKYPRGGSEMSPILFADIDFDGETEAIAFYVADSKGQNIHLAVMEDTDEGWEVTAEERGIATELVSVELVSMADGGMQLVVGYANATLTDKYLTVYSYENGTITRIYEQNYEHYLATDISGNGNKDLLVVNNTVDAGALTMQRVVYGENGIETIQTQELDSRFISCTQLYSTKSENNFGIIVEGKFSSGWTANEVFRLIPDANRLVNWPQAETDVPLYSLRQQSDLTAFVVEESGVVRVPTNVTQVSTLAYQSRFYFVTWQDYLGEVQIEQESQSGEITPLPNESQNSESTDSTDSQDETTSAPSELALDEGVVHPEVQSESVPLTQMPQPCFGIYDAQYGYFMELPIEWKGEVNILDGTRKGDWQIRRRSDNALLVSVRVASDELPTGTYTRVGTVNKQNILLYFSNQCTTSQSKTLRNGVTILS